MATVKRAANLYSFRTRDRVFGTVFQPDSPSAAALAAIDTKVADAHNAYLDRRFSDAIRAYSEARSLIFTQLHPGASGPSGMVSIDPALFTPMLSMALEWMNVLPVEAPVAAVRPREPVDPATLGDVIKFDAVGLRSTELSAHGAADAVADFSLGRTLHDAGNEKAGQFFLDRARQNAPELIGELEKGRQQAPKLAAQPGGPPLAASAPAELQPSGLPLAGSGTLRAGGLSSIPVLANRFTADSRTGALLREVATSVPRLDVPQASTVQRTLGVVISDQVVQFSWDVGAAPPLDKVRAAAYENRIAITELSPLVLVPLTPPDLAMYLPHLYYYVIPLGLAESYHAVGDYETAETFYLQAGSYQYLNAAIEAPYVWGRLATLYLDWGNGLFRDGDAPAALPIYEKVLTSAFAEPAGALYTAASLKPAADIARQVIAQITEAATLDTDPVITGALVEIRQQLLKIAGGLDFWGFWTNTVPIWTFDYLQSVARDFTQLAVSAERDVIGFWDRAGQAALTRQQLIGAAASSDAEVVAADLQTAASQAEVQAYQDGVALAQKRAADARANATEYAQKSQLAISYQAASTQVNGGDDGDPNQLNRLADQLLSGHAISDSRGTVAAVAQLAGAKANRDYEIDSLRRQAAELDLAATQAMDEVTAGRARVAAAAAAGDVARIRARSSHELLDAFDDQFFTADVWQRLGDTMYRLYQRYLTMALRAARLMQQAYNFETDQSLHLIRADYTTDEVKGLLGADVLLADIESFTYDLITSTAGKPQPIKQTISLAQRYPFTFESQLRKTGAMDFETRIDDFDSLYPGSYAGRIDAVEVTVDGLVPATGISGTLTNSGISSYRVPLRGWLDPATSGLKHRVQNKETLILSDSSVRQDALLESTDTRQLRLFQGAGLASSWRLELPMAVNDLDYGALLDVRLTFYYKARYDAGLAARVTSQLATLPGFTSRQRAIPLRWLYPDAFFSFQDTGTLAMTLRARDFPHNETNAVLDTVGVLVATDGSVAASGLVVGLATPGKAAVTATTDASGAADSSTAGSPYAALAGGALLGDYAVTLAAADNAGLAPGGNLDLSPVVNVVLLLAYTFTPRIGGVP
jgi:receptor-binding and translocation channel-forming TcA subunit of Tc toxin